LKAAVLKSLISHCRKPCNGQPVIFTEQTMEKMVCGSKETFYW